MNKSKLKNRGPAFLGMLALFFPLATCKRESPPPSAPPATTPSFVTYPGPATDWPVFQGGGPLLGRAP
ncbi:MAG: hypothetical protein WCI73_17090, partial [Phycisphaerae bacterium]